jgi:mRNA-degrading endonuclease HigB of HigAB toxin-antitoxin module
MKLIGRRHLIEFEGSSLAKRRLRLWVEEVTMADWKSIDDVRHSHPRVSDVGSNILLMRFSPPFDVFVEAMVNFDAHVVCVRKVGSGPQL